MMSFDKPIQHTHCDKHLPTIMKDRIYTKAITTTFLQRGDNTCSGVWMWGSMWGYLDDK